jgi:hypothetical protein
VGFLLSQLAAQAVAVAFNIDHHAVVQQAVEDNILAFAG